MACANPTDKELEVLRAQGFAVMISLLDEQQQQPRYNVVDSERAGWVRHVLPIREGEAPSLDQLERFRKIIQALPPDTKVLIHCSTGRGRAATFGAAYWIVKGSSATEPIKRMKKPVTRIGRHRRGKLCLASSRSIGIERRNEAKKAQ